MRAYGKRRQDEDCCPGHSLYPKATYNSKLSKRAQTRDTKILHRVTRHKAKYELKLIMNKLEEQQ